MLRIQGLDFTWVPKTDTAKTRPALERARYRCEHCPREDGLRVVEGVGKDREHTAVLCPRCAMGNGFKMVLTYRRQRTLQRQGSSYS